MTIDEAKALRIGQVIYYRHRFNADGTPQRWRVSGKIKTWKRNSNRIRVPLKHGLYDYGYLDESNLQDFRVTE